MGGGIGAGFGGTIAGGGGMAMATGGGVATGGPVGGEIGGGSGVIKDIQDNSKVMGYPAKDLKEFIKDNK